MAKLAKWYKDIMDELEQTVEYKVESIAFDISIQIYKQMKKLGLNKKDLAKKLNVSKSYITQLLKGKSNITLETLVKVVDALELTPRIELVPKVAKSNITNYVYETNWLNKSSNAVEEIFPASLFIRKEKINKEKYTSTSNEKEEYNSASNENEKLAIA